MNLVLKKKIPNVFITSDLVHKYWTYMGHMGHVLEKIFGMNKHELVEYEIPRKLRFEEISKRHSVLVQL